MHTACASSVKNLMIIYVRMCVHIGYNRVTTIPSGARHVNIRDDGTSENDMFIGMHIMVILYGTYIHVIWLICNYLY